NHTVPAAAVQRHSGLRRADRQDRAAARLTAVARRGADRVVRRSRRRHDHSRRAGWRRRAGARDPIRTSRDSRGETTMNRMCAIVAAVVASAASASAQPPGSVVPSPPGYGVNSTLDVFGSEIPIGPVVRGAPYSGEGSTTIAQTLGDGTRI